MIVDARVFPEGQTVETDVCIVGAGIAGVTLAREFIGREFRVCLLESGGRELDQDTQSLYCGETVGHPYYPLHTARARCFGGSSNLWHIDIGNNQLGARLRPLDEIDFEERDWIPYSGWPFRKCHLDPFYKRAESLCQTEPFIYDLDHWENPARTPRLPFIGDRVRTIIYKFGSRKPFIRGYLDEITRANNITTFLHANVVDIETNETAQTVTRLRVACLQGNTFSVSGKLFILAAGGIETPRLLLLSNKTQKGGLGNQNDLVGRFFMEHHHYWSGIFVPSRPDIFAKTALYASIHAVNGVPVIGKLALAEKVLRQEKLVNQNIQLIPGVISDAFLYASIASRGIASFKVLRSAVRRGQYPDGLGKHVTNVISDIDDIAKVAYGRVKGKVKRILNKHRIKAFRLAHMTEQVPNPSSRVTLTADRDNLGQNRARLDWQLSPMEILSTIRTQEIMDEELRRAGLGRLYIQMNDETPPADLHGGYHHIGTTRMHIDPKKGVVNENCQVHGLFNLFIAGPSVFPTGGYANPVLTIVALAVKLADHVKTLMRRGNVV